MPLSPLGRGCHKPTYDELWELILNVGTASTGASTEILNFPHAEFVTSPVCLAGELDEAGNAQPAFFGLV